MKKFCLALDLKDDAALIAEYEHWHQHVPQEIKKSISEAGVISMEIYRVSNRLFMIMETNDEFSFERKSAMDANNPAVIQWEELMWKYQQQIPLSKKNEKWILMKKIFDFSTD